jgi:di/tricarboxylate transporter
MAFSEVQMWLTFATIVFAIVSFSIDRIAVEVTALATLIILTVIFAVAPELAGQKSPLGFPDLLRGFSNPALVAVLSLIIVGQALFLTGALDRPTRRLARSTRIPGWATFALVIVAAGLLSAFLNNTPVVIMLVPILTGFARERRFAASSLLLPMNYATILGGSLTLIGSSTNLLVADVASRSAGLKLGLFDITIPGLVVAAVGIVYVVLVVPRLVGPRESEDQSAASGKQFIAEIVLTDDHPLVGTKAVAGLFPGLLHVTVRLVERDGVTHLAPFEDIAFEPGDRVVFGGIRRELAELGIIAPPRGDRPSDEAPRRNLSVAEAIVAPGSRAIGRTPAATGIGVQTGVHVAAVERRGRMSRSRFSEIRLEAGDVLLVSGTDEAFDRLRSIRDVLVLERSIATLPARADGPRALLVFAAMVALAATGMVPIAIAALAAAFALIAIGCINIRQARRAFDGRIFMLVGVSIALASALEMTGGAGFLADSLVALTAGGGAAVLLSALFALIAVLTNVLSNNATAVLFTPIAVSAAVTTGAPVEPFVIAVIFAANASFATPIAYQTNLLVMGPGGYRFRDFMISGTPLVIINWIVFTLFATWYYGL